MNAKPPEIDANCAYLQVNEAQSALIADVTLAQHSRFYQRVQRRYGQIYAAQAAELAKQNALDVSALQQVLSSLQADGLLLGAALRVLRQLLVARLIELDCTQAAPLSTVTQGITAMAELALDSALQEALVQLDARYGAPIKPNGERANMWVVGMGKLGARELNVSSDIDLIYLYDEDGTTQGLQDGRGRITCHEYFCKAVKIIHTLVGDVTEHGFVFRVDLALRPNGNSGPTATSLAALEEYFQVQGREWERFAWLKSRVVAPLPPRTQAGSATARAEHPANGLRPVVLPFVFRRYLDYSVFEALRILHGQIRQQANLQAAKSPERANDVKLGFGGIRQIEFFVQLLQVVRGGQYPELRTRATLDALPRLVRAHLVDAPIAQQLAAAYVFLRQVEHRIQYLDDQQTHAMPTTAADVAWIAQTMGFASTDAFNAQLQTHRNLVQQEFDRLLQTPAGADESPQKLMQAAPMHNATLTSSQSPSTGYAAPATSPLIHWDGVSVPVLEALLPALPPDAATQLQIWEAQGRLGQLRAVMQDKLLRIVARTALWLQAGSCTPEATVRFMRWLEPLLRRDAYLAMLFERPLMHQRLLNLLGAAKWTLQFLCKHPGVVDELADERMLQERFDADALRQELQLRRQSLRITGEDDEETLLNMLRRALHAEVFRTLARDVDGRLGVEQVADDLSLLADTMLDITAKWCWDHLCERLVIKGQTPPPKAQYAIIGYGKLGGKELGYGSDLDIVFVYDSPIATVEESNLASHQVADEGAFYAAFVRKLINWLTVKTGEGDLYEIDTALRPNGNSGLLITTFDAYVSYQQQRGSNTAWTWEHQAMTRARSVIAGASLAAKFDALRQTVIQAPRDTAALGKEIVAMRERMRQAHPVKAGLFDLKHSAGGMIDVEFAVQYLVLAHARQHKTLCDNVGNIALLHRLESLGLLPSTVGIAAADAYRQLRQWQHRARLDEATTTLPIASFASHQQSILKLWRHVFGVVKIAD